MADEPQTIRSINWRELFPFLHIFRAFRVAVHPSKLVLGLLALLTLYAGGRILDALWPVRHSAISREVDLYEAYAESRNPPVTFGQAVEARRRQNEESYAELLRARNMEPDRAKSLEAARGANHYRELKQAIVADRDKARKGAADDREKRLTEIKNNANNAYPDDTAKERARADAEVAYQAAVREAMDGAHGELRALERIVPEGIFQAFFDYEARQVNAVVLSVMANNWTRGAATAAEVRQAARGEGRGGRGPDADLVGPTGVFPAVVNFLTVGPAWLFRNHLVYAILFTILFLLVWAVFGGAISRIAAVHVARDEKISVRQALRFSVNKVLSFVFAPVIPLLIVLGIGVVLSAGGLLFYVPWVGPIAAGLLMILALVGGVVITLVLFGTVGGVNLMYPTVAVEGSDSFDAISRSFSYVFARPWRMLFYTALAVAYGALTYLFVKFFIYVVLAVTHFFVGWWLAGQPGQWYPEMWPAPSFTSLPYDIAGTGLKWSEWIAAIAISFWVYLIIGLLGAFAISFYFSANTIIYYLMRREVDATELEDVYVEETDDDLADTGPVTPAAAEGAATGGATGAASGTAGAKGPTASTPVSGEAAPSPTDPTGMPITSTSRATGMGETLDLSGTPGGGATGTGGSAPAGGSPGGTAQAYTSPSIDNPQGTPPPQPPTV